MLKAINVYFKILSKNLALIYCGSRLFVRNYYILEYCLVTFWNLVYIPILHEILCLYAIDTLWYLVAGNSNCFKSLKYATSTIYYVSRRRAWPDFHKTWPPSTVAWRSQKYLGWKAHIWSTIASRSAP